MWLEIDGKSYKAINTKIENGVIEFYSVYTNSIVTTLLSRVKNMRLKLLPL